MKNIELPVKYSLEELENLYRILKKISMKHYEHCEMTEEYEKLLSITLKLERKMKLDYICEVKIDYRNVKNINTNINIKKYEPEDILDFIVNATRQNMIVGYDVKEFFDKVDTMNECYVSSKYILQISKELGIECEMLRIDPGYEKNANLFRGSWYHYFNIIRILGKKYLVDSTYKQFFKTSKCSLERLGIPLVCASYPGRFMILNEERKKVSEIILKQGWIEATSDNLKHYLDGFTISFRNGLYYENFGISYDTDYTLEDYRSFFYGTDSQIKHENIEFLGLQNKPLKDYQLNFKIK